MFRRRGRDADEEPEDGFDEPADDAHEGARERARGADDAASYRQDGPWDSTELDDPRQDRRDYGGLLIPEVPAPGRVEPVPTPDGQVMFIRILLEHSAIEVSAFAAPRSEGIWDEVLSEIAVKITKQGGLVDRGVGRVGPELRTRVQVRMPDGSQGTQVMRFIGVDGPRWFLRGVVYGLGAMQADAAAAVDDIFREIVVMRGNEAMAPHDPIPLTPAADAEAAQAAAEPVDEQGRFSGGLNPFERGPEITEVR